MAQESDSRDEGQDEGVFKKPLSESPKRVAKKFEEDVKTKTPTESIEDDISGPATKDEE